MQSSCFSRGPFPCWISLALWSKSCILTFHSPLTQSRPSGWATSLLRCRWTRWWCLGSHILSQISHSSDGSSAFKSLCQSTSNPWAKTKVDLKVSDWSDLIMQDQKISTPKSWHTKASWLFGELLHSYFITLSWFSGFIQRKISHVCEIFFHSSHNFWKYRFFFQLYCKITHWKHERRKQTACKYVYNRI